MRWWEYKKYSNQLFLSRWCHSNSTNRLKYTCRFSSHSQLTATNRLLPVKPLPSRRAPNEMVYYREDFLLQCSETRWIIITSRSAGCCVNYPEMLIIDVFRLFPLRNISTHFSSSDVVQSTGSQVRDREDALRILYLRRYLWTLVYSRQLSRM